MGIQELNNNLSRPNDKAEKHSLVHKIIDVT